MKIKPIACDSSACVEVEYLDDGSVLITNPESPVGAVFTAEEFDAFIKSVKLGQYDRD